MRTRDGCSSTFKKSISRGVGAFSGAISRNLFLNVCVSSVLPRKIDI